MSDESLHWADQYAASIIKKRGDKEEYTIASGITPSGTIHVGNFREIITVELIGRALMDRGKKVRFIYSWDDYDAFRKVPKNARDSETAKKHLRMPITEVPDIIGGSHDSYARHNEKYVEEVLPLVGIHPEYIYQAERYTSCAYAEGIKKALEMSGEIRAILDVFRKEPLPETWLPTSIFCSACGKDIITEQRYEGGHEISYTCKCGHSETFDFRQKGVVKLKWRVDWPMRWDHENVDFEPGGKDHFAAGGSYDTASQISKEIYGYEAPYGFMYEWIGIKGGGQFSSSAGNVVTLQDVLDVYEPEMVRYLFAGSRPTAEFQISFDTDVFKIYEDWDRVERIYYGIEEAKNEKDEAQQRRIYELSQLNPETIPKTAPYQPSFRHLTTILLTHHLDVDRAISFYEEQLKDERDRKKLRARAERARNWLQLHAPEEFTWELQEEVPDVDISEEQRQALREVAEVLQKDHNWNDEELHAEFYVIMERNGLKPKEFFQAAYMVLIDRTRGPKLAGFVLQVKDTAIRLFSQV